MLSHNAARNLMTESGADIHRVFELLGTPS